MYTIRLSSFKCIEETNEVGADEPYVLVIAADIGGMIPNIDVVRYGPWEPVWEGEWHLTIDTEQVADSAVNVLNTLYKSLGLGEELPTNFRNEFIRHYYGSHDKADRPFWGMDNRPQTIKHPDDVVFVVALVENDDGDPGAARALVKVAAVASLGSSVGMDRQNRVSRLIADVKDALAIPTGAPNFDDRVGPPRELRVYQKDLDDLTGGGIVQLGKNLVFQGDGGRYRLFFHMRRH